MCACVCVYACVCFFVRLLLLLLLLPYLVNVHKSCIKVLIGLKLLTATYLNGVTVTGLTEDLEQCRVRDEEEPRKDEPFAFQISERSMK